MSPSTVLSAPDAAVRSGLSGVRRYSTRAAVRHLPAPRPPSDPWSRRRGIAPRGPPGALRATVHPRRRTCSDRGSGGVHVTRVEALTLP